VTGIYYRIQKHRLPVFHIHSSIFFNFVILRLKCMYAFYSQLIVIMVVIHQCLYQITMIVFSIFPHFSPSLQKCFFYSCDLCSEVSLSLAPGRWRQHVPPTRPNKLIILCGAIYQMTAIWACESLKTFEVRAIRFVCQVHRLQYFISCAETNAGEAFFLIICKLISLLFLNRAILICYTFMYQQNCT
jgi:hypothetical protein